MTVRRRKFIGAILLLALVTVWSLGIMALSQSPALAGWFASGRTAQILFYAIAGMGWVLPAMPLIRWMQRPDAPAD